MSEIAAGVAAAPKHTPQHTVEPVIDESKTTYEIGIDEKAGSLSSRANSNTEKVSTLKHADTAITTFEATGVGATDDERRQYRDGELVKLPAPTRDPKDPLNLPFGRKLITMLFLCLFGALAAAAELILGAMLPVFALQYSGIDPKNLLAFSQSLNFLPRGSDPLKILENLTPSSPPIWKIYMLASLPILTIGVANLALIPLAITMGRRPVLLICGVLAISGAVWAGFSESLDSHLGKFQGQSYHCRLKEC